MAVTQEVNVDETMPIYIKKERNTQAYKYPMHIEIDRIITFKKRNKVSIIKWRPIYKVIYEAYFIDSKNSQMLLCNNARIMQMLLNLYH